MGRIIQNGIVYSGNGGGSGGHTILDNEGDSLTQRTNLQFLGTYSEDDSSDDATQVNVVRSMTKAEFNLLSSDEKVGIINITDEVGTCTWVDLTGTLTAGSTSITIQDVVITTNSTIDIYTDADVDYNSITVTTGQVVVTFDAQASNMGVKVRVS